MPSRIAARLLTGPLAFFVAGAIDIGTFALTAGAHRLRRQLRALTMAPTASRDGGA